jgi:antitoxin VapB
MALSIKNEKTDRLIRELADLRGVSLIQALTGAVEEALQREKETQRKKKLTAEWLMKISRETAALMNDGKTSKEMMDELYDPETGLPV